MTQSKTQRPPKNHHYIPEFYLKAWTRRDEKGVHRLIEFARRWDGNVRARATTPGGTGYLPGLNTMKSFPAALAQQVEENFFQQVDDLASEAHGLLLAINTPPVWTSRLRSAWSRFIMSLLLRCPEDLDNIRRNWYASYADPEPELIQQYAALPPERRTKSLEDHLLEATEQDIEAGFFDALQQLIDHENVGNFLNNMVWEVFSTDRARYELLTSDRPVIRTNGIGADDGHLVLPISPRRLFVAARNRKTMNTLRRIPINKVVDEVNRATVCSAKKFVYASNETQLRFIQSRFGTIPQLRLSEDLLTLSARRAHLASSEAIDQSLAATYG